MWLGALGGPPARVPLEPGPFVRRSRSRFIYRSLKNKTYSNAAARSLSPGLTRSKESPRRSANLGGVIGYLYQEHLTDGTQCTRPGC